MEIEGRYKILDISEITESKYGKTIQVKANPIESIGGGMFESFTPYECKKTVRFVFPIHMVDELVSIARSEEIWDVNFLDFIKEKILLENSGDHIEIFRHLDFHKNEIFLKYTAEEVSFSGGRPNQELGEDHWAFYKDCVVTPYGKLKFDDFLDVKNNGQIGMQFSTHGLLRLNEIHVPNNPYNTPVNVKTLAMVRQPHNSWVYAWLFDGTGNPVMTVCGMDGIDENGFFLLHKYQSEMHKYHKHF